MKQPNAQVCVLSSLSCISPPLIRETQYSCTSKSAYACSASCPVLFISISFGLGSRAQPAPSVFINYSATSPKEFSILLLLLQWVGKWEACNHRKINSPSVKYQRRRRTLGNKTGEIAKKVVLFPTGRSFPAENSTRVLGGAVACNSTYGESQSFIYRNKLQFSKQTKS